MPDRPIPRRRFLKYFATAGLAGTTLPELLWAEALQGPVERPQLEACEKLAGLEFTDPERDLMLEDLNSLREGYQVIEDLALGPEVPPAFVFRPQPGNPNADPSPARHPPLPAPPPDDEEALPFLGLRQMASLLRAGRLSSRRLTEIYLERLRQLGPGLECVIHLTEERALEEAEKADRELASGRDRGLLHGLPWGAKDLMAARGYPTTWGAAPFREQRFDHDAAVVESLSRAGSVLSAKLTSGSLAWGDVWFGGKTRNPWAPEKGSSGSSAGSASATVAGLVAFSLGTETLGSIVSPSTRCGATGLRPTFGRVSRFGVMPLAWTMDKVGPICRSVEDCALVLEAISGPDERDPSTDDTRFRWNADLDPAPLRVGYLRSAFEAPRQDDEEQDDEEWRRHDLATLEKLGQLGFEMVPIELPDLPYEPLLLTISVEAAAIFHQLTSSDQDDELKRQIRFAWPNVFRQAHLIPAVEYVQAQRVRTLWMQEIARIFEQVDVYLAPSWDKNLSITNLTGHPSITLPNGFRANGTPSSITLTGDLFRENEMLAVAHAYQEATDFHRRRPDLSGLGPGGRPS